MAEPRVLILGLPYFGLLLAGELRAHGWAAEFLPHPGRSARGWAGVARAAARCDVLYLVSARAERGSPLDRLLRLRRRPTVVHWVGTDVLIAAEEHRRGRLSGRIARDATHWTDTPWLVDELRDIGIRAEEVPLPVRGLANEAPPLPARFTVLLYLPVDAFDREVFDMETILALPRLLPETRFVLVPSPAETLPGPLPPNLEAPGWVEDMDALYAGVSVYARLVTHDGMPFSLLEALSRGRHAIYAYELPGVVQARGRDEAVAALRRLSDAHDRGELGLNEEGMRWARSTFDPTATAATLDARLRKAAGIASRA